MKVLWISNFMLPKIAEKLNCKTGVNEGWLAGLSDTILSHNDIVLGICFPSQTFIEGKIEDHFFYYSYEPENYSYDYNKKQEQDFQEVYRKFKPDVIHIMGSEFPHSLAAINASIKIGLIDKTILSIQGLVSVYSDYYFEGIPLKTIMCPTIKDILRHTDLIGQKRMFIHRGKYEIEAITKLKNIIGRTDWDYACAKKINRDINYFFNNETLRKEFYTGEMWDYKHCEKHSIFVSQATAPFKGFHILLKAAGIVKEEYPDLKIYVASNVNYLKRINKISQTRSSYTNYLLKIIKLYNLENNIIFCGALQADQMKKHYLKSNVFVLPSAIENSPNSLGEAMILGVPIVTTDVGGIKNMICHEQEGFICQYNAPYMMAYYIMRIFQEKELAEKYGEAAHMHAMDTHDGFKNYQKLLTIYKELQIK